MPMAISSDSPIDDQIEKRPPTQSRKGNMLSALMPNAVTADVLVDTATKCAAKSVSLACCRNQRRAACALSMVSWVVKDFDATMNSVVAGSISASVAVVAWPSTFDKK